VNSQPASARQLDDRHAMGTEPFRRTRKRSSWTVSVRSRCSRELERRCAWNFFLCAGPIHPARRGNYRDSRSGQGIAPGTNSRPTGSTGRPRFQAISA